MNVDDEVQVAVGPVANGGHCVARLDGQVIFVRHALPGEVVTVRITEVGPRGRYLRADAIAVHAASPHRVTPPCRHAGECGGCDWQHADIAAQRDLKREVLVDLLGRAVAAELLADLRVEEVAGAPDGLRWRTRTRFHVDPGGRPGLLRHRSHHVVAVDDCLIARGCADALATTWPGALEVLAVDADPAVVVADPEPGGRRVHQVAAGRRWRVDAAGFWQVHVGAADALAACVRGFAAVAAGDVVLDLFAGVGLFAGALAPEVGPRGSIHAVESDEQACRDARRNLHDLPSVRIEHADVRRWLRTPRSADVVVLDPPRAGAGDAVVRAIAATGAARVVYVSCDPATLARDLATFADAGYAATGIRAFDCFPMTHHIETVVVLERDR